MKFKVSLGIALFLLLSMSAVAGTVEMQFNGTGSYNYNGEPTYPYNVSANGISQWMMCASFNEHISGGETWKANVLSIDMSNTVEEQAAWLFLQAVKDKGADSNINAAVWYLLEGVPSPSPEALAWITTAQGQTFLPGEFDNVRLYEAIPGTESGTLGTAQNFLGTPEPGTLLLLGSGVLGFAGMLRRKLAL